MTMVRINLSHTTKKPQTTIVTINGVDLFEVHTFGSRLKFLQRKLNQSTGKSQPGEYFFEVGEEFNYPTGRM